MPCRHGRKKILGVQRDGDTPIAVAWECRSCLTGGFTRWTLATEPERSEACRMEVDGLRTTGAV